MRTKIVVEDLLPSNAPRAASLEIKREAIALGFRTGLRLRKQAEIRRMRGKLSWQGDLDAMRRDK
jgi:Arc/MetJ family transcription regulator